MDRDLNLINFNVDTGNPRVPRVDSSLPAQSPSSIPENRTSVPHEPTKKNKVTETSIAATQERNNNNQSVDCNCGINTGYRYEFTVVYKKDERPINSETQQGRRDWFYCELIGNISTSDVETDRFLIYVK